jgi:hypothetical protein
MRRIGKMYKITLDKPAAVFSVGVCDEADTHDNRLMHFETVTAMVSKAVQLAELGYMLLPHVDPS